jgi:predicted ATP-binding protein involved in virulence
MSVKMMRVQRLELTHFRGIRHLTLDFPENVTVLVGVNGAGKTSILEALRVALALLVQMVQVGVREDESGRILLHSLQESYINQGVLGRELSRYLQESDIQVGQRALSLAVDARTDSGDLTWNIKGQSTLPGEMALHGKWHKLAGLASELATDVSDDPLTAVPLAIYYAAGRGANRDEPPSKEADVQNQLAAYEHALTGSGLSSTSAFVSWFRRREDYENEKRLDDAAFRDSQLQAVRRAVEELLPGFSAPRIRRQPMRMVVRKGDTEVDIKHLSDGERYLLTLGADIARRLALANPSAARPESCSAIILIDEIETHLHPSWQRRVVPALARAFPNSQFIITTHSPQVLSEVRPECVYLLRHEEGELRVLRPDASFGRDSNRILEDIMGVDERPSEIKQKLSDYFYLIDQGKMDEARSLRQELELLIGSDEPEFTRADAILRTRELLSR